MTKGWMQESTRHSLARKGIKTKKKDKKPKWHKNKNAFILKTIHETFRKRSPGKYPEWMSIDESDWFKNFEGFDELEDARKYAKKTKGQLYTQVDAGDTIQYERGEHLANRTGYYIVVK